MKRKTGKILSGTKDAAAVALGRRGGLARAKALTAEQRSEAARHAVLARWRKKRGTGQEDR